MRITRRGRRAARHLYRLCLVDGRVDGPRALMVARLVAESRRRGGLGMLSEFLRLVRLDRERHTASIESATPLTEDTRARVQSELQRVYGPEMQASFTDNPSLIGGMRITAGSDVYDGSVRARLAAIDVGW